MHIKKRYQEIEVMSGMSLYQLNEVCIQSSSSVMKGDTCTSDVPVFFYYGDTVFDTVKVQLRRSPELNKYVLVFDLK